MQSRAPSRRNPNRGSGRPAKGPPGEGNRNRPQSSTTLVQRAYRSGGDTQALTLASVPTWSWDLEGVVVARSGRPDRGLDPSLGEPLGERN